MEWGVEAPIKFSKKAEGAWHDLNFNPNLGGCLGVRF